MKVQPVVLCGGSGTRLWPLSREDYPKQLLKLAGEKTMLQATATRLLELPMDEGNSLLPPLLVGNEEYRFLISQQLQEVGLKKWTLILESAGRNTAPALTLAALAAQSVQDSKEDVVLCAMPADHLIQDEKAFCASIRQAVEFAARGMVVTLGVQPTEPSTGFGYIRRGGELGGNGHSVLEFIEKPDMETAKRYVDTGEYAWNSGIFILKASVWLEKIAEFRPDIYEACKCAFASASRDQDFIRPESASFMACPSDSIDYAVAERLATAEVNTGEVAMLPLQSDWSDLGSWSALWDVSQKDENGNVLLGDVLAVDSKGTLAFSESRLVTCVGLENTIVIETADAVLVANRENLQSVKLIVEKLRQLKRRESSSHRKVHRPWGWYDSVDYGSRFQVKHIMVKPGASLSLQMHHHRAEHWIVVSGTARVIRDGEQILLSENESTYIPLGAVHRLENPGKLPLEIVEVQSGSYLGEDDIVRIQDNYGR